MGFNIKKVCTFVIGWLLISYNNILNFKSNANVIEVFADNELIADDFLKEDKFTLSLKRLKPYILKDNEVRIKCSAIKTDDDIYFESERDKNELYFKLENLKTIKLNSFEVKK